MSLLDAFLEDGLAASVLEKSDVWFAIRKDGDQGSGTRDDPFDGSTAAHFDTAMDAVPANTTLHLGPTTTGHEFRTAGAPTWQPKSGQRIMGAGVNSTVLKIADSVSSKNIVAVGNPVDDEDPAPTEFLEGFELSDLTIDCNLSDSGTGAKIGGVSVTGKDVYLRRVRVIDFGAKSNGTCAALSAAWATNTLDPPVNCVIEECEVVEPYASSDGAAVLIALRLYQGPSSSESHYGCVIRNCYVDAEDSDFSRDYRGIVASGGIGTVVEGNRIRNCRNGGPCQVAGDGAATKDLVVRDNVYARVQDGISMELGSTQAVDRVLFQNNWIELGTDEADWDIAGIRLKRSSGYGFSNVVLRGNVIRSDGAEYDPSLDFGIELQGCLNVIVENNVIDVGVANNAIYHSGCGTVKPFNNQTSEGDFRPGYDSGVQRHDPELTTDVEDVILGLLK